MVDIDEINEKINTVIEWLLNDLPLLNKDTKDKLLDRLPLMSYVEIKSISDKDFLKVEMRD